MGKLSLESTLLCYHSADQPVFRRCTRCGRAACWCPLWFPLSPASPGCRARRRRTAGRHAARCCGTAGIWRCRTGLRGGRCRAASASPTPPRSGWQPRPRCEELRGRLEEEEERFIKYEAKVRKLGDTTTAGLVNQNSNRIPSTRTNQCRQDAPEFNQF